MPFGPQDLGPPDIVFVEGVAAIDDGIAGSEQVSQLFDGFLGDFAGWQHDPCGSRSLQKSGQVLEIGCASHALSGYGIGSPMGSDQTRRSRGRFW